jgi:hypothetical protein
LVRLLEYPLSATLERTSAPDRKDSRTDWSWNWISPVQRWWARQVKQLRRSRADNLGESPDAEEQV